MANTYNWQNHYGVPLEKTTATTDARQYVLRSGDGSGSVTAWDVMAGIQVLYNDLYITRCSAEVESQKYVIELSYCLEGSYECAVSDRCCYLLNAGDFTVCSADRLQAGRAHRLPLQRQSALSDTDGELFFEHTFTSCYYYEAV